MNFSPESIPLRRITTLIFSCLWLLGGVAYSAQIELIWDPPDIDPAGYRIHFGTASAQYNTIVDVGKTTTYTITGLEEGNTYYFAATAYYDNEPESDFSNEIFHYFPKSDVVDNGNVDLVGQGENSEDNTKDPGSDPETDRADLEAGPLLPIVETGEIIVGSEWAAVDFAFHFVDPVVIAQCQSKNDADPAVVRLRHLGSGVDMRLQEWDHQDGAHAMETIGYAVMERGAYTLEDGTFVEAGRFETQERSVVGRVIFTRTFRQAPVVLAAVSTFNEADALIVRVKNVDTDGFDWQVQEQELNDHAHSPEIISYIAWEPSIGAFEGMQFEVNRTGVAVGQTFHAVAAAHPFAGVPLVFVGMQTINEEDTATLRIRNRNIAGFEVHVDEEASLDPETGHAAEDVGYMVFSPASPVFWDANPLALKSTAGTERRQKMWGKQSFF